MGGEEAQQEEADRSCRLCVRLALAHTHTHTYAEKRQQMAPDCTERQHWQHKKRRNQFACLAPAISLAPPLSPSPPAAYSCFLFARSHPGSNILPPLKSNCAFVLDAGQTFLAILAISAFFMINKSKCK